MNNNTRAVLVGLVILVCFLQITPKAYSGSPPSNTIPIIADRPNLEEINLDTFLMLSWHYFDVVQAGDYSAQYVSDKLVDPANETGMYICISPAPIQRWGHWPTTWAARMSDYSFSHDSAYARPEWAGITIPLGQSTYTFTSDTLIDSWTAISFDYSLDSCATVMDSIFGDENQVWFYNTFDEAPSRQWANMVDDTSEVDNYIPNLYTQATHVVGSATLPTFEEVDPEGVFSWLKQAVDNDSTHTVVCVFGLLHTVNNWAGYSKAHGTFTDQANSIESYLNMKYQEYGNPTPPLPKDNFPELFLFDCYPFRQVGATWLIDNSSPDSNYVNSTFDLTLLEHFESGMDSTFITVRETALDQERDIPALYYPQIIGKAGGEVMWEVSGIPPDTILDYASYAYRVPTVQEFRLNCNIALMRDIRALIPYCMKSYESTEGPDEKSVFVTGFLDRNNIPFDAPYEEWVYTNRWRSDFDVIPPDSFPPFSDSCRVCGDFDPLWDLPARPDTVSGSQRTTENYMMWKFDAYGRLWNSMRSTFAEVATIAPEYTNLHWWEDYAQCLEITSSNELVEPQVRLFNDGSGNGYAFYVNRNCYDETIPVAISLDPSASPMSMLDNKLLDHSRRFLLAMESDIDHDYNVFQDTLEAGQSRLVQYFGGSLPADIRITEPDISASGGGEINLKDYSFPAETVISVDASFYNMGTLGASDVIVHLNDITDGLTILDTDTISFSGLSSSGYVCDSVDVSFSWRTDSDDIGVHILEVEAEALTNEPDTDDNSTTVVFQITPRDYATTVLANAWNMTEATSSPPAWHTNDIVEMVGWSSTYPDSISGMFEGTVSNPSASNKLRLNTGGAGDHISTRLYDQFSMIAKAEDEMTITIHWQDVDLSNHSTVLSETIDEDWGVIGPVNLSTLSSDWSRKDVLKFWLEFSIPGTNFAKDVRIGWVKLTE